MREGFFKFTKCPKPCGRGGVREFFFKLKKCPKPRDRGRYAMVLWRRIMVLFLPTSRFSIVFFQGLFARLACSAESDDGHKSPSRKVERVLRGFFEVSIFCAFHERKAAIKSVF